MGDEGSGAYFGKRILADFVYGNLPPQIEEELKKDFGLNREVILENVYRKPLANRYLASFTLFLSENRGHFMIENIIEDGLNDFFFYHLCKYNEAWKLPISFVGSVAFGFKDVLKELCGSYEFELGKILKSPMTGLTEYHS